MSTANDINYINADTVIFHSDNATTNIVLKAGDSQNLVIDSNDSLSLASKTLAESRAITNTLIQGGNLPVARWLCMAYSPELRLFVSIAFNNNITARSTDGINWTVGSCPTGLWNAVEWSSDLRLFVATSNTTANMRSPDGINWTLNTPLPSGTNYRTIAYSPLLRMFVTVGFGSSNVCFSRNGLDWTLTSASSSENWSKIVWSPELALFCCIAQGNATMTSRDGIAWTGNLPAGNANWNALCWSSDLNLFCALATGTNLCMYSSNGVSWTLGGTLPFTGNYNHLIYNPTTRNFFALVPLFALAITSTDGVNFGFVSPAPPTFSNWGALCWSSELDTYACVSDNVIKTLYSSKAGVVRDIVIGSALSDITINGMVNLTNSTNTTSAGNGALVIAGGVGIRQDLRVGNNIFSREYNSTNGAFKHDVHTNVLTQGLIFNADTRILFGTSVKREIPNLVKSTLGTGSIFSNVGTLPMILIVSASIRSIRVGVPAPSLALWISVNDSGVFWGQTGYPASLDGCLCNSSAVIELPVGGYFSCLAFSGNDQSNISTNATFGASVLTIYSVN